MSAERSEIIQRLLEAIDGLPADQKRARLEAECPDDAELVEEILSLDRFQQLIDSEANPFAEDRLDAAGRKKLDDLILPLDGMASSGLIGQQIGAYRVLRQIGAGGMGVVYEAEQSRPERRVALKIIDAIRGVPSLERRLAAEAEILGRLQHPGIAQVFEAGVERGPHRTIPFFAMELIEGLALDRYALDHAPTLREKLELIAQTSEAIGHAHDRGVVHRDLKPGNVLVTRDGRPKVLDFGIASIGGDATLLMTTMTREGEFLGTLGYMAPEQLEGMASQADARADVFSLGVMTYELIAGRSPHQLAGLSLSAAIRVVDGQDPPPLRQVVPGTPRDIATIVGRCLERDPTRRYQDGNELAADIRRHLDGYPIVARPPTRVYRASRFVRRNRTLVAGIAATVLVLAAGVVVSGMLASKERASRVEADRQRRVAERNELRAVAGVVSGARSLTNAGDAWQAARQLRTIEPRGRGWLWRHEALRAPWVITNETIEREVGHPTGPVEVQGFVDADRLFAYVPGTADAWTRSLSTGAVRRVPLSDEIVEANGGWARASDGLIGVELDAGGVGRLDVNSGTFTPVRLPPTAPPGRPCTRCTPARTVASSSSGTGRPSWCPRMVAWCTKTAPAQQT